MSQTIDTLSLEIESNAASSVDGVRKLSRALTSLSKSISSVNGAGIGNVASNVNLMSSAFANVGNTSQKATSGTKKYANTLPILTSHTNRAVNSTKSLAYYFGKFYANMFLVIRGVKAFGSAISDTMGYMESFNFWDVAISSAASKTSEWEELGYNSVEAYATGMKQGLADFNEKMTGFKTNVETGDISVSGMSNLGINLTNLTTFQAEIISITSSLGLCTQVSNDTSKALSMLVGDMSSLKNIDIKTVMTNFQSGLIGQSRALYKYGIDITNATLQTYAYKYGIEKAVSEMTQAEKMQLRMLAILDQSKVAWGDLANTIEQPANGFRVLSNGVKNLAITIGKILMPVVSATLPYLNAMVRALQSFFTWMANILGIELDVKNTGTGTTDIFDNIEDSADDATDSVNKLRKSIRAFDELNVIDTSSGSSSGSSASGSGSVDLSSEINSALAEYEKAWEEAYLNMNDKTSQLAKNFENALAPVRKLVEDIKIGDWFAVGGDVSTIASGIFNFFSDAIEHVNWEQVGHNFGLFLSGINWKDVIKSGFRLTFDIGEAISDVWFESFNTAPIETAIITGLAAMKFTGSGKALAGLGAVLMEKLATYLGMTSINLTVPVTLSIVGIAFAYKVGEKMQEIEENIKKYGDKGRGMSGDGWIDNVALAQYDIQKSNNAITMSYADTGRKQKKFFKDWGSAIKASQKDSQNANNAITMSYADMGNNSKNIIKEFFENWGGDIQASQLDVQSTNHEINMSYADMSKKAKEKIKDFFNNWGGDIQASQTDIQKANNAITMSYTDMFTDTKKRFEDWKTNATATIEKFKTDSSAKFSEWKVNASTTIANWKSDAETQFSTWKANAVNLVENFKSTTGVKFSEWKTNSSNIIADWKSNAENRFVEFKASVLSIMQEWYNKIIPFFSFGKWNFNGVKDGLTTSFNNAIAAIKEVWNKFADWLNKKLTWTIDPVKVGGVELFKGTSIKLGKIPTFASGGITSADIFAANENGVPELVGTIGRKSAIASGTEVTGIADAVYSTASEQNALLRQQNELLREILAKPTLSNNDVFRATKSAYRQEASRLGAQGNPALVWG